jgi:uncharacterized phage-associated protein
VSARDVAAVFRRRSPGLPTKKLHKLLYYAQGHHLATFGLPLFSETISAWDMGPVVGELWFEESERKAPDRLADLNEAQLNTVGYVLSRYGGLSGLDLEHLTHTEAPWRRANRGRRPHGSARIEQDWLADYFGNADSDDDDEPLDSAEVREWLAGADARRDDQGKPDDLDGLRTRLNKSA